MNVDETGKHSDDDSILVGYDTASLGNQFPAFLKNKSCLVHFKV
jgi:hypothetical protein